MSTLFPILRIFLGLAFGAAAVMKIAGAPMMVQEFGQIGLGQGFRFVTAALEIVAAVLLIRTQTVSIGAGLLVCVCIGAGVVQVAVLHGDVVHCIVLGVMAAVIGWHYRLAVGGVQA